MAERRKFSEVLYEYISACNKFNKEERDMQDRDYYYGTPLSYQEAEERKDELAEEIDSFFPQNKENDEVGDDR